MRTLATERAYQRGDLFEKRRRLMAEWERSCEQKPVEFVIVVYCRSDILMNPAGALGDQ